MDASLGDRGDEDLVPRINRLDVLRHHLRRGTGVRLFRHHTYLVGMGVEADDRQAQN